MHEEQKRQSTLAALCVSHSRNLGGVKMIGRCTLLRLNVILTGPRNSVMSAIHVHFSFSSVYSTKISIFIVQAHNQSERLKKLNQKVKVKERKRRRKVESIEDLHLTSLTLLTTARKPLTSPRKSVLGLLKLCRLSRSKPVLAARLAVANNRRRASRWKC